MTARLFFSYSHADEGLRNRLEIHLAMLKREGTIAPWHDRRIAAGKDIDHEIDAALQQADVILFLVSPDFLASDYCYDVEVTSAMKRHEAGVASVIPVILRPCEWHRAPFGRLRATPSDGRPVTKFPDPDDAFLEIVRDIRKAAEDFGGAPAPEAPEATPAEAPQPRGATVDRPRSGNLRVKKEFTDADRDQFRQEAFEYIARFFEYSLDELKARNSEITIGFRRLDANRFTATAYRNGRKIAGCTISLGNGSWGGNEIVYSGGDHGDTSTANDMVRVGNDEQSLFLRTTWAAFHGRPDEKLSMEGGAEHFWAAFLEPLQ